MSRRNSVERYSNPRKASKDFVSQLCEQPLVTTVDPNGKRLATDNGNSKPRSVYDEDVKKEDSQNGKPTSVSLVDLGCWAPLHSIRAVRQVSHQPLYESPSLIPGGVDGPSEKRDVRTSHSAASGIQISGSNGPRVYVYPVPDCSVDNPTSNAFAYRSTVSRKGIQHHTYSKSRHRKQQDVRDVQLAIQRLSSKLRRMELDEVLLPAALKERVTEKYPDDAIFVTRGEIQEIASSGLHQMCSPREHFDINHGRSFPEIKSARARPRCRVSRRKRDRGWPNIQVLQEDCCDEGIKEHNRRVLNVGASKINPSERGILGSQAERAQALHMGSSLKGSLDDVDFIEQGTFSVSKRKMCPADTSKLAEASKINCAALASSVQEGSVIEVSLDAIQELPESNELKNSGVRVLHPLEQNDKRMEYVTARSSLPLEHLPMNSKAVVHSESIAQFDAANNHVTEHYLNHPGGNWSKSPCFSKLLLNSSDVSSSSSEDSSELSQALQNLSGGQSNKSTNTDMCCPADPELRHSAQQSVASFLSSEKGGATAISSHYQKALLWILEQDTAYQRSALHIDMTLILRRFGNLLLHMVPHEGVHMLTLEPLFKETFSVAKSFLKVFSLYVFELNKESLKNHYLCVQKDKKVSSVRMAPLPTTVFLHEHHIRYGIQALLNEAIFDGFDKVSCCGIDPNAEGWIFLVEYQCFCMVAPMDAINPMNESYNREFHSFCSKKLQLMKDRSPWLSEWPDRLLESFLEAMKYVWLAHLIVCASVNGVHILQFQQWSPYDSLVMEVADHDHDAASFIDRVQFMLCPGFELQSSVIKSEVYLIPKNT